MSRKLLERAKHKNSVEYLEYLIQQTSIGLTQKDMLELSGTGTNQNPSLAVEEGIGRLEKIIYNNKIDNHPFSDANMKPYDFERPELKLVDILRRPEYFSYTCYNLMSMNGVSPLRIMPFQGVILRELWNRQFPMLLASRGAGKSFLLGLYILLRMTFQPGVRIAVVAKSLRQSMIIWEYCSRIWHNSPVLRDLVSRGKGTKDNGPTRGGNDRCEFRIGESLALFLPLGANGDTIRGIRAQVVIADEFGSILEEVYAVVVAGFGSVSGDPVGGAENKARERILKALGLWNKQMADAASRESYGNQSIIAGTASYQFNHFYKFYKNYKEIISSGGDTNKIEAALNGPIPQGFDWKRYCIMRLPWSMIPHGYMDEATIGRAKQISTRTSFLQEYECCFLADSDGFFKQSIIDFCTIGGADHPLPFYESTNNEPVDFTVRMNGNKGLRYVYGIDPAYSKDNFCVCIIEVHPDHRRVVYSWTTNKTQHKNLRRHGKVTDGFYRHCTREIRDMFKRFPPAELVIDSGSGGGATGLIEAFSENIGLEEGELPIYEVVEPGNPKDTDRLIGHKLIRMFNFSKTIVVCEANYGLSKDLESRLILFPRINAASYGLAYEEDMDEGRVTVQGNTLKVHGDTLENVLKEIEDMKEELATIVHSQTRNGTEHWDVPGAGEAGRKGGYMKKDRYSALLMANWGARNLTSGAISVGPIAQGGFANEMNTRKDKTGAMYIIPGYPTIEIPSSANYGTIIRRSRS